MEYKQNFKNKSQEYAKFLADKKSLITIIFRQFDKATKTKISPRATYAVDCQAGRLIDFLKQLCTIFFDSDDGVLSYVPYKQVVAVKSINNYTNYEPYDPHGFKEQVKIKYKATTAVARKFPS